MTELPSELLQKWNHSFEEDSDAGMVYRPVDYRFPRARGRAGIEFLSDGRFIEWAIGATDAQVGHKGQWQMESPGYVAVSFEGHSRSPKP